MITEWDILVQDGAIDCSDDELMESRIKDRILKLAKCPDPRTFKDKTGAIVKALERELFGRFSFKPGTRERYEDVSGNYRIVFGLETYHPVHDQFIELYPKDQIKGKRGRLVIYFAGHRSDVYDRQ